MITKREKKKTNKHGQDFNFKKQTRETKITPLARFHPQIEQPASLAARKKRERIQDLVWAARSMDRQGGEEEEEREKQEREENGIATEEAKGDEEESPPV